MQALNDDRYRRAVKKLADCVQQRTEHRPEIVVSPDSPPSGNIISVGIGKRNPFVIQNQPPSSSPESYRITSFSQDSYQILSITGGSVMGDIYGMYRAADKILTEQDIFGLDLTVSPTLKYRFVDTGTVGVPFTPQAWDKENYSHNTRAFHDVILNKKPYIDEKAFAAAEKQFKDYVHRMISYGYNGIIIKGFLEFINFDRVGQGFDIYSPDSDYRRRHLIVQKKFGKLFHYAH